MLIRKILGGSMLAVAALTAGTVNPGSDRNKLDTNQPVATKGLDENETTVVNRLNTASQSVSADKYKNLIKFEDDKNEVLNGKICRAYLPKDPKGKPLFILVLGHVEELDFSPDYSGIMHLYEKLKKEEKGTVLLFRTGLATDEIGSMFSSKYKPQYEPKTVFKQTKEIAHDFITKYEPSELRLGGFSWGSGTVAELASDDTWRKDVPVMRTVMIDPIAFGSFGFGMPLRKRPEFTNSPQHKNFHVYQRKDDLSLTELVTRIQGNYPIKLVKDQDGKMKAVKDERVGDVIWRVPDTSHLEIDDLPEVRQKAYEFLTSSK